MYPYDNVLIISTVVANFEVKRILIDNKSATNILSHETFTKMEILASQLKAIRTHLQGFGSGVIVSEGVIELPLTLGFDRAQVIEITPFQVIRTPMAYNAFLGRPLLNKIQAIVSTFHLTMKLSIGPSVGLVRGDRQLQYSAMLLASRE